MVIYYKGLSTSASVDEGKTILELVSSEEEKKKARRIVITDVYNNPLLMDIWLENERIAEEIPLEVVSDATPERVIDLDVEIPVGKRLTVKIKPQTAGNQGSVRGWVEYELV